MVNDLARCIYSGCITAASLWFTGEAGYAVAKSQLNVTMWPHSHNTTTFPSYSHHLDFRPQVSITHVAMGARAAAIRLSISYADRLSRC